MFQLSQQQNMSQLLLVKNSVDIVVFKISEYADEWLAISGNPLNFEYFLASAMLVCFRERCLARTDTHQLTHTVFRGIFIFSRICRMSSSQIFARHPSIFESYIGGRHASPAMTRVIISIWKFLEDIDISFTPYMRKVYMRKGTYVPLTCDWIARRLKL